jgi:hypothetical protein
MYILMILGGGRQVDALLLSASAERLRVVMPGRADTTEFRLVEGQWTSESGGHVEVGAILAGNAADAEQVLGNAQGRSRTAV